MRFKDIQRDLSIRPGREIRLRQEKGHATASAFRKQLVHPGPSNPQILIKTRTILIRSKTNKNQHFWFSENNNIQGRTDRTQKSKRTFSK